MRALLAALLLMQACVTQAQGPGQAPVQGPAQKPLPAPPTPAAAAAAIEALRGRAVVLSPEQVVDDFHQNLAAGWREGALLHLVPDLLLFEQGYVERSREGYASGQMQSDMVFAAATRRETLQRDSGNQLGRAWVTTQARVSGQVGPQAINLRATETMLLRHIEGRWQITHIHWSAHSGE